MKLYYSPGACSLAPHIALFEAGFTFEAEAVDLKTKITRNGRNFLEINPKGSVPALELRAGEVLTEAAIILQYIADEKPDANLIPKFGIFERYRALEWVNFVATEMHKGFSPLFKDNTPDEYKKIARENLQKRFDYLSNQLATRHYLLGEKYCIADTYLFTVLRWSGYQRLDLPPTLKTYMERIRQRPATSSALAAESIKN